MFLRFPIMFLIACFPRLAISQEVRSFHPVVTDANAIVHPEFEGKWVFGFSSADTVSVRKAGDNFYHLSLSQSSTKYEAMLGKLENITILQLFPLPPETMKASKASMDFIPVYRIHTVNIVNDTLHLSGLNYTAIANHAKNDSSIKYVWSPGIFTLNIPTQKLQKLLAATGDNEKLFNGEITLSHIPSQQKLNQPRPKNLKPGEHNISYRQNCIPLFPLKKGWFGGDGNVSVATSPRRTLWLFSDSFVGDDNQLTRRGSSIIANSVGVMNCEANGRSYMEYYWKEKYTSNPKPIFESGTTRYRFWVNDALLHDSMLYVVLEKIGPRSEPTASDETFNFQHVGWTLARVDNPYDSPDNWAIEYIPITGIPDKKWNGQFALNNGYVYVFFRKDSNSVLARYPVQSIEIPLRNMQYYTKEKRWRDGSDGDDAAVLFSGEACQTLEYHPGIKKWRMIIGPGFWSNKIKMREASELTGPWSDEIVLFECPEQTPGSSSYHKDNFCYLGREHVQFYDAKTRTMLLTYDHNTVDFQKLLNDTSIYVPKVIRIKR